MACIDDVSSLIVTTTPPSAFSTLEEASTSSPKRAAPTLTPTPPQLHGSLLAQTLLSLPGPPSTLIQSSLLALPPHTLLALSLYQTTTHIVQSALLPTASNTVPFRRKLINLLLFLSPTPHQEPILTLALSPSGSHVLDSLLISTSSTTSGTNSAPLFSLTERIATTLVASEPLLRDSFSGRIIWRNWSLDLFKRRRGEWVNKLKSSSASSTLHTTPQALSSVEGVKPELDEEQNKKSVKSRTDTKEKKERYPNSGKANGKLKGESNASTGKSAIQLAREKFAAAKASKNTPKPNSFKGNSGKGRGTGANAGVIGA